MKGPSEAEFTRMVLELAKLCGWRSAHFRPARTAKGWRTAVQGDGKGFPDLVLVKRQSARRGERMLLFVELKTDNGILSDEQAGWADDLICAGATCLIWRPCKWNEIEKVLKGE